MDPYHAAKHCECCAATDAAGPFNPLKTIAPYKIPELIYLNFDELFTI
jgi:hypothetical protein